ncbi:MAG: hypothetical protein IT379_27795 [Deltaproteobacteria bacterium]|nr:hypothetical protein [Deltaproteobacteria bacterium]
MQKAVLLRVQALPQEGDFDKQCLEAVNWYLEKGWKVKSVNRLGRASYARLASTPETWLAALVVLEHDEPQSYRA